MSRYFLIILLPLCLLLSACGEKPVAYDLDGKALQLSKLDGKWLVVNYWAGWCKPCYTEIPALNKFSIDHAKRVVVVGVNFDNLPAEKLKALVKKFKIHYAILTSNPAEKLKLGDIRALPTTFILSPDGKVVKRLMGPQHEEDLEKVLGLSRKKKKAS